MSGEKDYPVTLRRSEYNKLMNNVSRTDSLESNVRHQMNQRAEELRKDFQQRMRSTEKRLEAYDEKLSGFQEDIRELEARQNRKLRQQAKKFQNDLNALQNRVEANREEYLAMFEEYRQALEAQRQNLQSQINQISDKLAKKEANARDLASAWMKNANNILAYIQEHLRHEKFKPGELAAIQAEMQLSESNFRNGVYEAAISSAQQSYLRASALRLEIEQLEMEWSAHLGAAKRSATELLATCEAQESCKLALETDEGAIKMEGRIDFWTNGALSDLKEKAKNELQRLDHADDLPLEQLKVSIRQSDEWRGQCEKLAEKAKQTLIASQLRNNMAQNIANTLKESGWEVSDSAYEGEDHRGAMHVKLENYNGDEIVTIIIPEEGEGDTIQNRVRVSFFDRSSNDETYRGERLKTITAALKEEGMDNGEIKCVPGTENKSSEDVSKLDFAKVRQTQVKAPLKQEVLKK